MNLNDEKIKKLIKNYNENPSLVFEELKKEVSEYIYYFPKMAYKKNLDICGDFYLYIIERLDKIIANFNSSSEIKFKTWFNYVLKNNFINFMKFVYKNPKIELSIEDYQDSLFFEVFEEEEGNLKRIESVLENIEEIDRLILKLYYIPELINEKDVLCLSENFNLTFAEISSLQKKLIELRQAEIERLREVALKIKEINSIILEKKYTIYKRELSQDEKNKILFSISKLEAQRFKLICRVREEKKDIFETISVLFSSKEKARYRLKIAKDKFKFYYLKIKAG
ncbi:MAG: hypothetical protein N2258_02150 [Brevinematales bacterium]|nr:hypothetical protein [Brevinematales bacterium]